MVSSIRASLLTSVMLSGIYEYDGDPRRATYTIRYQGRIGKNGNEKSTLFFFILQAAKIAIKSHSQF